MSHIFRSDDVQIGERVVVRRRFGDHFSDVIGHVTGLDPLTIRPQEVGGYPSDLPSVEIPAEQIYVVKRLSPRMVRNTDIRHIEQAYALAFPGLDQRWSSDGQWLLRAGDGITERSNSAAPLGASAGFTPPPLDEFAAFYSEHNLPVRLLIPERIGRTAENMVAASPNWQLSPEILVMTHPLDGITSTARIEISDQPDDDWLALYHFRGQALPRHALDLLRSRIDGHMAFARLVTDTGETVAITRATITESDDGTAWLGYSAVEVAEAYRRQGLGTQLAQGVMSWAAANGADAAYLQVVTSNQAGIGLYEKLGFVEHHRHRYAELVV